MASLQAEQLLIVVADFSFEKGWITEEEKLEIITSEALEGKNTAILALIDKLGRCKNAARLRFSIQCINEVLFENPFEKIENRLRRTIMLTLFDKGLVTKNEVEEIELKLQEELPEMCDVDVANDEDDVQRSVNPLELGPVIDCVLKFLNFEAVKECRMISKEWAKAGLQILKPNAVIKFRFKPRKKKSPTVFLQLFPEQNEKNKNLNFTSFQFLGSKGNAWAVEELNNFFQIQQMYIHELTIQRLSLVDNSGNKIKNYSITHWISRSPMAMRSSNNKTKLDVSNNGWTKISIDISGIRDIFDLSLRSVCLNLQEGVRILPFNLDLTFVSFSRDGNKITETCVNDLVDFEGTKNIILMPKMKTRLSLDLIGCHAVRTMWLGNIELRNWSRSRWIVANLILWHMSFTERTQMQIKELKLSCCQTNLFVLPQSLQKLVIGRFNLGAFTTDQPTILPHLKLLTLEFETNCSLGVFQNVKFPNLDHLAMKKYNEDIEVEMDLAWLSTSTNINTLYISGITITNSRNEMLNLDNLELLNCRLSEITYLCTNEIKADVIVISVPLNAQDFGFTDVAFLEFLESQRSNQDLGQRIYVRDFSQIAITTTENPLHPYLVSGKEDYVFENNLPNATITRESIPSFDGTLNLL